MRWHNFCPVTNFEEVADADEKTTMPFPMKYDLTNASKKVQAFEQMLSNKRSAVQLNEMGL